MNFHTILIIISAQTFKICKTSICTLNFQQIQLLCVGTVSDIYIFFIQQISKQVFWENMRGLQVTSRKEAQYLYNVPRLELFLDMKPLCYSKPLRMPFFLVFYELIKTIFKYILWNTNKFTEIDYFFQLHNI